ncbi:MAG: DEAD/DEAH box helicase family protein [Spirochaetia bacterium]|nr:DEAD/DEAH box helicase family protein [Spirochaetia bacterium]
MIASQNSPLHTLLDSFRSAAMTEREKGTYFEELVLTYFRNDATYRDLYSQVWLYADWAQEQGKDARDTGIDLVAKTAGTDEYHAVQCKFYAPDHRVSKSDIDSFFTASGKAPFTHRVIITTTNHWNEHAEEALRDQTPPVTRIDLYHLENSQIDWEKYKPKAKLAFREKKKTREHQKQAIGSVVHGLTEADRGKLIMACGTGKTFTSMKIAEELAGPGKRVLFLVPSLALLSQSLTEWTQESAIPLHSFAVCSDSEIGNKRKKEDDTLETFTHELQYPATTHARRLAHEMKKRHDSQHMSVVFSTYHSIEVLSQAQKKHTLEDFDLIICDEAHRTTGATFDNEDESMFVRVHDQKFIRGKKRLYMTATPRIYAEIAKATAEKDNIALYSMDEEKLYGKELHVITFSEAVKRELLVDYKVIVLAVDEAHVSQRLQALLADENNDVKVDDAAKIIGCWKALSKQGTQEHLAGDQDPMHRAVAFCQVIEFKKDAKVHKVASKLIAKMFQAVVEAYQKEEGTPDGLICEGEHVDGTMNATEKEEKIRWLKAQTDGNTCRILSNVRCLSEGVDVPALDAVLFLTPRSSQVDVVQSVGRVMRNAPGKKRGYVILPVVIPAGIEPHEALNDNKTYKVVWQVLQALRSHDDRFDAMINKLDLVGPDKSKMEVIAVTDKLPKPRQKKSKELTDGKAGRGGFTIGKPDSKPAAQEQHALQFEIGEIERAIYARVVQKCGNRRHWEEWANDIARIANTHIARITAIVSSPGNHEEIKAFTDFADELRDDLNDSITNTDVIEMLAQHLITRPVFDALFNDYKFAKQNPVSLAMDRMLTLLQKHHIEKEADTLQKFYDSVKLRAQGIDNAQGKQKIIIELYDKFFRNAFPKMTERLGIVYTPVEVVDFIIRSVNDLLKKEFGQTLGSKNVHILDPFTGTGTFITRLLQSGLIAPEELPYKYKHEIHANEIVLLAYYIAAINIEATYHDLIGDAYAPFEGICLTDTFQLYEKDDLISNLLVDNSTRRSKQKALDIRVIMCNPPYSSGQESANDNNQNVKYPILDERIENTYAKYSSASSTKNLYDSYIRSIRWASDRLGNSGVLGFVTNASYIDGSAMDGMRKCLADEFSSIYLLHLRGNQRTSGEISRKEGGKIFGGGSRAPIAIGLLVKNPATEHRGRIYFKDIGDYLKREEKLGLLDHFGSLDGVAKSETDWLAIHPNTNYDWIEQRDSRFSAFISIGDKNNETTPVLFDNYSLGLNSNRDAWVYASSSKQLEEKIGSMIKLYNRELQRYERACKDLQANAFPIVDEFVSHDEKQIKWSSSLKADFGRHKQGVYSKEKIRQSLYRPFFKQWLYYDPMFNHRVGQMPKIFPTPMAENLVITVSGVGARNDFSVLMSNHLCDIQFADNGQCFPLYLYGSAKDTPKSSKIVEGDLFGSELSTTNPSGTSERRHAITDVGLDHFQAAYSGAKIMKEDIFYYVYGLLHSPDYRAKYADNLSKELPRIPCVKSATDFWHFTKAGRALAELHVNYEKVKLYPVKLITAKLLTDKHYHITQIKYGKAKEEGQRKDLTTIVYNEFITITDIPLEAHDYIVNGKSALDWIVERYCVKTDKDSGIVNDANLWATETENNPKYILEMIQRITTVSLETMKIVKALPPLTIQEGEAKTKDEKSHRETAPDKTIFEEGMGAYAEGSARYRHTMKALAKGKNPGG